MRRIFRLKSKLLKDLVTSWIMFVPNKIYNSLIRKVENTKITFDKTSIVRVARTIITILLTPHSLKSFL